MAYASDMRGVYLLGLMLGWSVQASAGDMRELCPDRPGLGTPACTIDPGHVMVEVGLADWTLARDAATRTDTILAADTLVRIGVADHAEVQFGWTPYGHVRERDRMSGAVTKAARAGDVTLAFRRNLINPDGSGPSIALMPYASLPVGRTPIGAGDWGTGLIVPMSFDLGSAVSLDLTPEMDAAVDGDGDGRHLAYGIVAGLGADLSDAINATIELSALRDRDPAGHATESLAGVSMGWHPQDDLQLDAGANIGLNHASADLEIYVGISRRF